MKSVTFTLYPESKIKEYKSVIDKINQSVSKKGSGFDIPEKLESLFEDGFTVDGRSLNEVMSRTIDFLSEDLDVEDIDLHYGRKEDNLSRADDDADYVHYIPIEEIKRFEGVFVEGDVSSCLEKAIKEYREDNPERAENGSTHYLEKIDLLRTLFKKAINEAKVIVVHGSVT
jgi:hypothetical protein